MKKVISILIIIIVSSVLIGANKKIFPIREEITNMAMTRVLGVDREKDKVIFSLVINRLSGSSSSRRKL